MDTKELFIAVRNANFNNETTTTEFKDNLIHLLEKLESHVFKPEASGRKFNAERWLRNSVAVYDSRDRLKHIYIDEENTVATDGKHLCIYKGQLNRLENGYYLPRTMEKQDFEKMGPYPNYRQIIPERYAFSFEAEIKSYKGAKSNNIKFEGNGDIVNVELKEVIGTHNKPATSIPLMFNLEQFGISTDKQTGKVTIRMKDEPSEKFGTTCKLEGFGDNNCYSVLQSIYFK
jgi:hypothetical protein